MTDQSIIGIVTLATLIVGHIYNIYREERQRRWDKEDREEIARVNNAHSSALAEKLTAQAAGVAAVNKAAIAENTEISKQAFHEANSVNMKIAAVGRENNDMLRAVTSADHLRADQVETAAAALALAAANAKTLAGNGESSK